MLRGAHDGFTETLIYNTALIRRRTRNPMLTMEYVNVGRLSRNDACLCYIADRVAQLLKEEGAKSAVIDLGGNVVTLGQKPDGEAWKIGVQQPFGAERSELIGLIEAEGDLSLVTSGVYERNFERNGVLYHHILDPRTGFPADTDVIGVTVVSASSARGDALSTVCLLLGMEEGSRLLEADPDVLGAVWVDKDGEIYVQGDIDFTAAP